MPANSIIRSGSAALLAAACAASASATPNYLINISGATLFEPFFLATGSTTDTIDIDADGLVVEFPLTNDQLAPNITSGTLGSTNAHWAVQYRAVGSGNGLANLVSFGQTPATAAGDGDLGYPDPGRLNRASFSDENGVIQNGLGNASNPGNSPYVIDSASGNIVTSATGTPQVTIDIAVSDVKSSWFVTNTNGLGAWNAAPRSGSGPLGSASTSGYGNSPIASKPTGSGTGEQAGGQANKLKSLGSLNLDITSPDADTVFDTPIAFVPVAFIANHGTGIDGNAGSITSVSDADTASDGNPDGNIRKTELQYLFTTGRMNNGENLIAATRDSGSGTRNAAMNSIGVDPSWGVGDNVGVKHADGTNDTYGEEFVPTNKNSSSRMEQTTRTGRLVVGYTGLAGSSKAAREAAGGQYEILNVMNDTNGGTKFVRPIMTSGTDASANNVVFNDDPDTGWQVGGSESFYTIGDPLAGDIYVANDSISGSGLSKAYSAGDIIEDVDVAALIANFTVDADTKDGTVTGDYYKFAGNGSGNPAMANKAAALYIRNILDSIDNYTVAAPGGTDANGNGIDDLIENQGTPGQLLSTTFSLVQQVSDLNDDTAPDQFVSNYVGVVANLQAANVVPTEPVPAQYGDNFNDDGGDIGGDLDYGRVPVRLTSSSYSDGLSANYETNDGTSVTYGTQMTGSATWHARNAIAGDFDDDGDRDKADIDELVTAYENSGAGGAATTTDAAGNTIYARDASSGGAADLATNDPDAVLEILGDFDGDGNFNLEDVRYFADGLGGYASDNGGAQSGGSFDKTYVDRKFNFTRVDDSSASGNLFGTTLANGTYSAGDSRADVAGADIDGDLDSDGDDPALIARGAAPSGADGTIDEQDLEYVMDQYRNAFAQSGNEKLFFVQDGEGNWSDINEAVGFDFSADMTGDAVVNKLDAAEIFSILETTGGDVDLNGTTDVNDYNTIIANFGDLTDPTVKDGDLDGDDVVDAGDAIDYFDVNNPSVAGDGAMSVVYDESTGDVEITLSGSIVAFELDSYIDGLLEDSESGLLSLDGTDTKRVMTVDTIGAVWDGTDVLNGTVTLAAGLGLDASSFLARFADGGGASSVAVSVIPEPATLALAAFGAALVTGRRRRGA